MNKNIIKVCSIAFAASFLASCSDSFLEEKKDNNNVNKEVYNDFTGAQLRVNSIYGECLPNPSSVSGWNNNCTGLASDIQAKATEEY